MQTALTADWLCSFFTSHPIFIVMNFKIFYGFPHFWPSGFKGIITVNHCKQSITNQEPPAYECVRECNDVFFQNFCTKQMFFSETYKFNNVSWVKFISITFLTKTCRFLTIPHELLNDTTKCVVIFCDNISSNCRISACTLLNITYRQLELLHNSLNYSHLQKLSISNLDINLGNLFHSRPAWTKVVMSTSTNSRTIKTYKVNILWVFGAKRITQISLVIVLLFVQEWGLWTDKSATNSRWMWQIRQHTLCTADPQMWAIPKEVTQQTGGQ